MCKYGMKNSELALAYNASRANTLNTQRESGVMFVALTKKNYFHSK